MSSPFRRAAGWSLALVAAWMVLTGCDRFRGRKVEARDAAAPTAAVADASPSVSVGLDADAGIANEPPLAWGTRPALDGELFAALDGPCEQADVYALVDGVMVVIEPQFLVQLTKDGIDPRVGRGVPDWMTDHDQYIDAVSGRVDDLWLQTTSPGSIFREARLIRRKDGLRAVAPFGTEKQHYLPPEPFRGGSLGVSIPLSHYGVYDERVFFGLDLPKGVTAQRTLAGIQVRTLHALEGDQLVILGTRADVGDVAYLLGPNDVAPKELAWKDRARLQGTPTLTGRTLSTLRISGDKVRFRLEGHALVEEEGEHAPEWRSAGDHLQRLVGAGYHEVELPKMPISGASPRFHALTVAADGEAIVSVQWAASDGSALFGVLRSRRPKEVLRCTRRELTDANAVARATTAGIESWPPLAGPDCSSPFVVVAHREGRRPLDDMPKTRAAVAPLLLERVASVAGRTVVGARAPDMAAAKVAVGALQKIRVDASIVCATPELERFGVAASKR